MPNRVPDPSWKKGPEGPTHSHSDHDIWEDDYVYDFDGPGRDQSELYYGDIFIVVIEAAWCGRDGCDAEERTEYIYTVADVGGDVLQTLGEHLNNNDDFEISREVLIEGLAINAQMIDYDDGRPVLGIEIGDDVYGYITPTAVEERSTARGECHGAPDPPEPDIDAYRYDDL